MKVTIRGGEIETRELEAPPSKSYTHRAIAIASLADGESVIDNPLLSSDIKATINGCRAFGAKIKNKESGLKVEGFNGNPETPDDVINLGNSGTSLRFLTGVASLLDRGIAVLTGDSSLRSRPNQPLIDALNTLGAEVKSTKLDGTAPLVIKGSIRGGEVDIRGDISSQYISSLLINAPYAPRQTKINITTEIRSKPYLEITREVMEEAGVKLNGFNVPGNTAYRPIDIKIPGDFSSASNILALAAVSNKEITIKNLGPSKQGDEKILDILDRFGAKIKRKDEEIAVKPGELTGISIDANNTPDLLPILSVIGTQAKGKTSIHNVEHARYKESDRIKAMATELKKMDAEIEEHRDGLTIHQSKLKGSNLDGYDDHRIVMALSIAAIKAEGETTINTAESIKISYPEFFKHLRKLGIELTEK